MLCRVMCSFRKIESNRENMKFNNQEYAKNILEMCENFYNDSNLPKIDLIEPILQVMVYHNVMQHELCRNHSFFN